MHSSNEEMVAITTSTDDSPKRMELSPFAKSDMYKTRMCRNYMETGKCKYGRVCQFAHGRS